MIDSCRVFWGGVWIVVMQNYEAKRPSYFATPSPQLIHALHTSLSRILSSSLEERFAAHRAASRSVKSTITHDLGLRQLAESAENQANAMTAFYLPDGVTPVDVLPKLLAKGVVLAGGLHRQITSRYVRLGHMGVTVVSSFSFFLFLSLLGFLLFALSTLSFFLAHRENDLVRF